jgi:hypothetical protein
VVRWDARAPRSARGRQTRHLAIGPIVVRPKERLTLPVLQYDKGLTAERDAFEDLWQIVWQR